MSPPPRGRSGPAGPGWGGTFKQCLTGRPSATVPAPGPLQSTSTPAPWAPSPARPAALERYATTGIPGDPGLVPRSGFRFWTLPCGRQPAQRAGGSTASRPRFRSPLHPRLRTSAPLRVQQVLVGALDFPRSATSGCRAGVRGRVRAQRRRDEHSRRRPSQSGSTADGDGGDDPPPLYDRVPPGRPGDRRRGARCRRPVPDRRYQTCGCVPIGRGSMDCDASSGVPQWAFGGPAPLPFMFDPSSSRRLRPHGTGWFATAIPSLHAPGADFAEECAPAGDGTGRWPATTPVWPGLELILEVGVEHIQERCATDRPHLRKLRPGRRQDLHARERGGAADRDTSSPPSPEDVGRLCNQSGSHRRLPPGRLRLYPIGA